MPNMDIINIVEIVNKAENNNRLKFCTLIILVLYKTSITNNTSTVHVTAWATMPSYILFIIKERSVTGIASIIAYTGARIGAVFGLKDIIKAIIIVAIKVPYNKYFFKYFFH